MSTEEQFDFYWKEIFDGLPYNPIEFNVYRFDQSMSLPSKFNKLYDMFKQLALNNQEVMGYLKAFMETFDFKLETTIKDILIVWLNEGLLADVVREAISEEVIEARTDYLGQTYLTLKERLDLEREEVITARGDSQTLGARLEYDKIEVDVRLSDIAYNMSALIGDGLADDSIAIQDILTKAVNNKTKKLVFPKAIYRINNPLFVEGSDIEIDFSGSEIRSYAKSTQFNTHGQFGIINIKGSMEGKDISDYYTSFASPPVSAPVLYSLEEYYSAIPDSPNVGSKIKTSNNNHFNVGDEILLIGKNREDTSYDPNLYQPEIRKIATVISKDVEYLYLDYFTPIKYSTFVDTVNVKSRVVKINTIKNVTLKNVVLNDSVVVSRRGTPTDQDKSESLSGVFSGLVDGLKFENVSVVNHRFSAFFTVFSRNIEYKSPYAENPQLWSGGLGYLTQIIGSRDIRMENVRGIGNRHLIDFSWSSNAVVDIAYHHNGRGSDFSLHGLAEHDITLKRCQGNVSFGHGIEYFPNIMHNVTIENSKMVLGGAVDQENFLYNLTVRNSELHLGNGAIANAFSFRDSKIFWSMSYSNPRITDRDTGLKSKGLFENCEIILRNSDNSTDKTIGLANYDEVVFKNTSFMWGTDPLSLGEMPKLRLFNIKKLEFNHVDLTQTGIDYRIFASSNLSEATLVLDNVKAKYEPQSFKEVLKLGELTNVELSLLMKDNHVSSDGAVWIWFTDIQKVSNSKILAHVINNKFLSSVENGTRFIMGQNEGITTLITRDNMTKNLEFATDFPVDVGNIRL